MAILPFLSVGASILGSIFGNNASKRQEKLSQQQFQEQQLLAQEQLALARDAARMGKATQVDASGNMTVYDEASNTWKVVLTAEQQRLLDAGNFEQYQQLTQDAPLARAEGLANARRRSDEGAVADTFLSQVREQAAGRDQVSPEYAAGQLRLARERAVTQGLDDVSSALSTQAMRSGAGNLDQIAGALAKQRSKLIAQTMGSPELEGRQMAEQMNTEKLMNTANLYGLYAGRAANGANGPTNIPNIGTQTGTALAQARGAASSGVGAALSGVGGAAAGLRATELPQPSSTYDLFGGLSSLLASPGLADQFSNLFGNNRNRQVTATGMKSY